MCHIYDTKHSTFIIYPKAMSIGMPTSNLLRRWSNQNRPHTQYRKRGGGASRVPAELHNYTMSDIDPHPPKEWKYINLISLRSINISGEKITFWQYFFAVFLLFELKLWGLPHTTPPPSARHCQTGRGWFITATNEHQPRRARGTNKKKNKILNSWIYVFWYVFIEAHFPFM